MPWCGPCQRYFAPTALRADGTCPACGEEVEAAAAGRGCEPEQRAPWHFWAVVVAAAAYVAWRIVQLVAGAVGV